MMVWFLRRRHGMYDHVRPGGTAVLENFDVGSPDRAFGDHVLEWELIYRSP